MKTINAAIAGALFAAVFAPGSVEAQQTATSLPDVQIAGMQEDTDGVLQPGEFEVISTNGSITRALCPHTCGQRRIPASSCRQWKSQMHHNQCYVEDTRNPSNAIAFSGPTEAQKRGRMKAQHQEQEGRQQSEQQ